MNKYKKNSIDFFNKAHAHYGSSEDADADVVEFLRANKAKKVLDLSCGNGRTAETVQLALENVKLIGIDISDNSIAFAKARNLKAEFLVADVDELPLKDRIFEAGYTINAFHHYPEPEQSMQEISRVLKTGGKFLLVDIYLPPIIRQIVNLFLPFGSKGDYKIYSKAELKQIAESVGLQLESYKLINPYMFKAFFIKK